MELQEHKTIRLGLHAWIAKQDPVCCTEWKCSNGKIIDVISLDMFGRVHGYEVKTEDDRNWTVNATAKYATQVDMLTVVLPLTPVIDRHQDTVAGGWPGLHLNCGIAVWTGTNLHFLRQPRLLHGDKPGPTGEALKLAELRRTTN